jgi:hypothetical protein
MTRVPLENLITGKLGAKIKLIKLVRRIWPTTTGLKEAKELVEAVGEAFVSVYYQDTIDMFEYMDILMFAYRLRIKDDLHYCVDSISERYADARMWRVKKALLHQWLDQRVV